MNDARIAQWARELSGTEDEIGRLQDVQREQAAYTKKCLAAQRETARHLLGLISGREGEQLDLPAAVEKEEQRPEVAAYVPPGALCKATTKKGKPCTASGNDGPYCAMHAKTHTEPRS